MDSRRLDTVQVLSEDLSNTKYNEGAFESLFFCPQNKAEIMHRTKPFESALFGMMPTITLLTKMPSMRRFAPVFLLLSLAATFLIYQRGLSGAFVFDDGPNIIHNSGIAINDLKLPTLKQAAFSGSSGPMMRPISMLSFAANYYATGLNPYYFKLTNLVIHLFNGIGVFALTALLLSFYRKRFEPDLPVTYAQWLSLAVATAWLLHPLNLTSVLYIVQRMTSLSAFFSIWGLVVFVWGRARLHEGKNGVLPILASMLLFTPLAALSKENGLLLPVFMLVAEAALFIFYAEKPAARRFLIGFYVLFLAIPAAAAIIYGAMHLDDLLAGYRTRGFTLPERVMTEARVVWFYIWQILLPSNAQMGLHHDDIAVSRGLFQPVSTALSLAGVACLPVLAFISRKKAPLVTFGVLFFLTWHLLESTVLPLEIAHEHRNYLPMYGILLMLFFYLLYPLRFMDSLRLRQTAAVLLIGIFAFNTFARAGKWANPYDFFQAEVDHHPNSAIINNAMGDTHSNIVTQDAISMEMHYFSAREYYEKAVTLDRNDTDALFGLIMLNTNRSRAIEPGWIQELASRLEGAPYAASTSDKLTSLTQCQLEGRCKFSNNEFESLLQAALRNSTLTGSSRAKVLYALSSYLINVARDYPAAIDVMHKMVQVAPQEVTYRFALINFLVALRRIAEAKEQLVMLKQLNTLQDYSAEITLMEQTLSGQDNNESHH